MNKEISSLQGYSDIIRKQGEEARNAQEAKVALMQVELPEVIASFATATSDHLLECVYEYPRHASFPPENELWDRTHGALQQELSKRLAQ